MLLQKKQNYSLNRKKNVFLQTQTLSIMKNGLLVNALILVVMAMLAVGCQKDYETLHAELVDGETFCKNIPAKAKSVVFECNSSYDKRGINLSSRSSPVPVFGHLEGEVWCVTTRAGFLDANPNSRKMFYNCSKLTSIKFGSGFNTSNVEHMDAMFYGCSGLTSLDVSNFNTSNVVSMTRTVDSILHYAGRTYNEIIRFGMFTGCSSLTSLDLSSFNTSKVTDMRGLLEGCNKLTSLNVSSFNTSNVQHMDAMFKGCSSLTSLDLSNFNTSNVVSMGYYVKVFSNSGSWGQIQHSGHDDNGGMFMNRSSLTSLNISSFNTSNVTNMCKMFYNCTHLTFLDLSNFDMTLCNNKGDMCCGLSTSSGACTIVCTESVQNSLLEFYQYIAHDEDEEDIFYYYTGIPVDEVTFTWVRP